MTTATQQPAVYVPATLEDEALLYGASYARVKQARRQQAAGAVWSPIELAVRAGITPDPWQEDVLRSDASRLILNCSRQAGKSTTVAVLATHTALTQAGSLTLIVSRAERQSGELMAKVKTTFRALGQTVAIEGESALQIRLENHSRIIALPGKEDTIRSFSGVSLLILDEASRVPDATYYAVRPMLAVSGGRLVILSTPFGQRGFFWEQWQRVGGCEDGDEREWQEWRADEWHAFRVPAPSCPRMEPAFLADERVEMGDFWFKQEYLCQFIQPIESVFNLAAISDSIHSDVLPLFGQPAGMISSAVRPLFGGSTDG